MKINQKYLAEKLNVSRVTVTKALQDSPDISPDTRKKVKELAEELGYIPNGVGRSLSTKKTNTIGIVVPKIDHSFFSQAIESMYSAAADLGYQVVIMVSFEDEEKEKKDIRTLLSMNVDGIIIDSAASIKNHESYNSIKRYNVPFLFFDRISVGFEANGIYFDDYNLSCQATTALIKKGYTQIAYMVGPLGLNISKFRLQGFKDGMKKHDLSIPSNHIINTGLTESAGYESFKSFIKNKRKFPQAVMCINDSVALGVYKACEDLKINIPDQIGVVGFGNLMISKLVNPPLSTIDLPVKEAGRKVIERLVEVIKGNDLSITDQVLSGNIIFRDSITSII